jgi:outer membrane receptor for ferrienterochelin and colicins
MKKKLTLTLAFAFLSFAQSQVFAQASTADQSSTPAPTPSTPPSTPAPAVPAPTPTAPSPTPTQLEQIEVRGNRDRSSSDGITRIVGQDELTKNGDSNVLDVLKRQPGVTISGGQISLRGIGSAYVRVLVDGQRPPPGFSLDSLAPGMVERIEIMPSSGVEFSSQSIGGTINIILKRTRTGQTGTVNLSGEANQDYKVLRGTVTWGDSKGPWAWFLNSNFRYSRSETVVDSSSETFVNSLPLIARRSVGQGKNDNANFNIGPRLTFSPNPSTRVQLQAGTWFWRANNDQTFVSRFLVGQASLFDNSVVDYLGQGHGRWFNGELNQTISDSSKLEVKTRAGRWYSRNQNDILYSGATVTNGREGVRSTLNAARGRWEFLGATLRRSINAEQNLSVGVEFSQDADRGVNSDTLDGVNRLAQEDALAINESTQHAAFVRYEYQISNDWATDFGVRWERLQFEVDGGNENQRQARQGLVSPSIQIQYKPGGSKTEQYRFELGRKWKALRAQDLSLRRSLSVENKFDSPDTVGNPNLQPEKSINFDLAYTRKLGTEGSIGATLLYKRIDDVVLNRLSQNADGRWIRRTENVGAGQTKGLELEYRGLLSELSSMLPKTQFRASLGRYWSAVAALPAPGNRVASQTPLNVNIGFDHRMASHPITWGASFRYSERGLQRNSEFDSKESSNERALGMYASWVVSPKMTVRLAAENMLGGDSIDRTQYARADLLQTYQSVSPVKPFVRLTFDFKL